MSKSLEKPPEVMGYQLDARMPLHQLAVKRIKSGRDLKIIITAKDSQTGVGKTTLAGWLALVWTEHFTDHSWWVDPDTYGEGMGTLNPKEYFTILQQIPDTYGPGSVVVVDDAEELDARRSMQSLNVEFSQRWMLMRLKQAITIITLPSPKAIDSRLEELADIWINIERRGRGLVHDIRVNSYGSRNVMTEQKHKVTFPDVSGHEELEKLRRMKEMKMDEWDSKMEEDDTPDPDEVEKDVEQTHAQKLRENTDMTLDEIGEVVDKSASWVSRHTNNPAKQ